MADLIKVLMVDDFPLFRRGLTRVLEGDPRFAIAGEAEDGPTGLALIRQLKPDIAVLDVTLPGLSGLEIARQLQGLRLPTRVIILTMHKDEATFNQAMDFGALGFVLKDNAVQEIVNCLAAVARGEPYVSPSLSSYLVHRRSRAQALVTRKPGLETLTKAERRVLKLVAEKKTTAQIAAALFVSPRTIEAHRANLSEKLGLRGSHSLLQFALENRSALDRPDGRLRRRIARTT